MVLMDSVPQVTTRKKKRGFTENYLGRPAECTDRDRNAVDVSRRNHVDVDAEPTVRAEWGQETRALLLDDPLARV